MGDPLPSGTLIIRDALSRATRDDDDFQLKLHDYISGRISRRVENCYIVGIFELHQQHSRSDSLKRREREIRGRGGGKHHAYFSTGHFRAVGDSSARHFSTTAAMRLCMY